MMNYKQRSIWGLTPSFIDSERNDSIRQRENRNKGTQTVLFRRWHSCPAPVSIGFLLGAFLAGIALATILTLFLQKQGSSISTTTTSTSTTEITTSTVTATTTTSVFNVNLVTNGDAESGSCQTGNDRTSPIGWSFSGPITQLAYSNTINTSIFYDQTPSTAGPSDRGQCYFFGYQSDSTSMWQSVDFSDRIDPLLIDNQTVKFNFSAWIGGINTQNDSVVAYLTFIDTNNQIQGNTTSLGPVFATDRANETSLIFQQANGLVPIGARSLTVLVTITRYMGLQNNGDIDNIVLILYQ